jgi:hypothetical protein
MNHASETRQIPSKVIREASGDDPVAAAMEQSRLTAAKVAKSNFEVIIYTNIFNLAI